MPENKIDIKNIETILKELIAQLKHNHSGILLAAIHALLKTPGIDQSLSASLQEALAKLSLSGAFVDYTKRAAEKMPDERALMIAEIEVLYHKYEEASHNFIKALDEVSSEEFLNPYFEDIDQKNKAYQAAKGTPHEHRAHTDLMESVNKLREYFNSKLSAAFQMLSDSKNNCENALDKTDADPSMKDHGDALRHKIDSMSQQCNEKVERCNDKIKDKFKKLNLDDKYNKSFEDIIEKSMRTKLSDSVKVIQSKNSYTEGIKPSACKVQDVAASRQHTNNIKTR